MAIRLCSSFSRLLVMQEMEGIRLVDEVAENAHEDLLPAVAENCECGADASPKPTRTGEQATRGECGRQASMMH